MNRQFHKTGRVRVSRAFTLIELLLVLVILGVLAAIVVPKFTGRAQDAKITKAKTDIANIRSAIERFEVDNSRFPTQEEGLAALVDCPPNLQDTWKGYLDNPPIDPWGKEYLYKIPGQVNQRSYDVYSAGPDGQDGTPDDIYK
jgi:general secretion pathway protein G